MGLLYNQTLEQCNLTALTQGITGDGVVDGFAISESLPAAMSILCPVGSVDIGGVNYPEVAPQNVAVTAADATNARKDLVTYNSATSEPIVIVGSPAASPVPPNIPADNVLLAIVHVAANATSIVNADIEDGGIYLNEKLQNIDAGADVTGDNVPQDHVAGHLRGGADEISYYSASGSTVFLTDPTEDSTTLGTYTKLLEKELVTGSALFVVSFEIRSSYGGAAGTAYGAIFKNGVQIGLQQANLTTAWETKTQTLGPWADGDDIQIYAKSGGAGATAYIKNMKILGTMTTLPVQPTWS